LTTRVRILIAGDCGAAEWEQWQAARAASPYAARIVLQRVPRAQRSVGLGYGETVRWSDLRDDTDCRRQIIEHAAAVLEEPPSRPLPQRTGTGRGIVILSHAETDLLALERARAHLPADFPPVAGYSFNELGTEPLSCQVVIARVHGPVPEEITARAQAEGWSLVAISGVGAPVGALAAYFQAGGVRNIAQALRFAAREYLGINVSFEPPEQMPAHGLYHPDLLVTTADEWNEYRDPARPLIAVLFYRAHVLSGNLQFVDEMLRALESRGCAAIGIFTSSLRDVDSSGMPLSLTLLPAAPDVVVNTVSYPVVSRSSLEPGPDSSSCFEALGSPLLQAICCGTTRNAWQAAAHGLSPVETAMNVALPECDGRVIAVPVSFKESHRYLPDAERVGRVADLARRFATLRRKSNAEKRIAVVLANSGGKAQRVGDAVGLDTPASLLRWLMAMRQAGYEVGALPASPEELMTALLAAGCYDERHPVTPETPWQMPRRQYLQWFQAQSAGFQQSVRDLWGAPCASGPTLPAPFWRSDRPLLRGGPLWVAHEPHSDRGSYLFCGLRLGNVFVAIQPPRSFGIDAETAYHAPDLPPCHHYVAFYRWLADVWGADALIHFGTHGTLEWLPGKSLALSADCAPDALLGDMPHFYPFIVNNPGEGAQAKRRTHAVIVDHLVPPLTQAECHGALASLARLVEEYYRAEVLDPSKLPVLRRQIWDLVCEAQLATDLKELRRERHGNHDHGWDDRLTANGTPRALDLLSGRGFAHLLEDLDAYLCDLGRAQIRGGLHVFGQAPQGTELIDLLFAVLRGANGPAASLIDGVTCACGIRPADLRDARGLWKGPAPEVLSVGIGPTAGQIRAAIDGLARRLLCELAADEFRAAGVAGLIERTFVDAAADVERTLLFACEVLVPNIARTSDETRHLLQGLDGRYVPAGPAGAPTRGMAHVLPTGRNFYTLDPRGLPTQAAWTTGLELANLLTARHFADTRRWPESVAMSVWGTPTLRTGGDEIAQALALIGVRPVWDLETRRTCGTEIVPLSDLGRPRIDVTLRVSGFFRDSLAVLIDLFDAAVQRVAALDESAEQNFIRKHWLAEGSSPRVFGPRPGAYGTGLLQTFDDGTWRTAEDLASIAVTSGGWALGGGSAVAALETFRRQLARTDLVVQCHDSREQDLFDASDYFEFSGGLAAAAAAASLYFADSSDPGHLQVRTLQMEALRVYRSRVVNPKWLEAMQRHGSRGALEMASTVDCLFGYAATTGIVTDWMFEGVARAFVGAAQAQAFLERCNPWALNSIAERLLEAEQRGLWSPLPQTSALLRAAMLESEAAVEEGASS
jgi:cobaltochelatase CobN